jgi:hypothetical protein
MLIVYYSLSVGVRVVDLIPRYGEVHKRLDISTDSVDKLYTQMVITVFWSTLSPILS